MLKTFKNLVEPLILNFYSLLKRSYWNSKTLTNSGLVRFIQHPLSWYHNQF